MSKSLSQPAAPNRARLNFRNSSLSANQSIPFTSNGHISPPLNNAALGPEQSMSQPWQPRRDDSFYTMNPPNQTPSLASRRQCTRRNSALEKVPENPIDFGEDPADFFARMNAPAFSFMNTPIDMTAASNSLYLPLHAESNLQHQSLTPVSSSSMTLTNTTTLASDMSRQSSICNDAIGGLEMFKFNSNTSFLSEANSADEYMHNNGAVQNPYPKLIERQNRLLSGAGGAIDKSQVVEPCKPSTQLTLSNLAAADMKRSESNESSISNSSSQSRAKLQLQRQNQLAAARPLMPKAGSEDRSILSRNAVSQGPSGVKSHEGNETKPIPISKSSAYVRPKHERVFCDLCPELVDGFRGPHELGRHHDRVHKKLVKKWICVEPAEGTNTSGVRPIQPLAKCKTCSQQKKKYGAYYNAAAHLRRAHFRPKPRGRGKSGKADEKIEKRGGKGGGLWPSMNELKHWMKEVYDENRPDDDQQQQEDDASEDDEECIDGSFDDDTSPTQSFNNPQVTASSYSGFDNAMISVDKSMFDAYPSPVPTLSGGSQAMQAMQQHVQLPFQQQSVIDSMPIEFEASQAAMFGSSVLMDADLAFMGPSFSQAGDQYGPGLFDTVSYIAINVKQ